jgi:hypothetical protein
MSYAQFRREMQANMTPQQKMQAQSARIDSILDRGAQMLPNSDTPRTDAKAEEAAA